LKQLSCQQLLSIQDKFFKNKATPCVHKKKEDLRELSRDIFTILLFARAADYAKNYLRAAKFDMLGNEN
jgi:hypothetical protein